ncbi:MAG TPA: hypothetical protein VE135_24255 [Pyrinomonadaceae bacterium]|nr:hypothetical protein [Pyrinomonadaceae bacterium]
MEICLQSPVLTAMFESEEQRKRVEFIIMTLAKLYVVLELSPDACPVCCNALSHDAQCPILLAWSLLDEEEQHQARTAIRALALSIGRDDSSVERDDSIADPVAH